MFVLGVALALMLTDAAPLVPEPVPPTAEQVGAARAAVRQFRTGQARKGNSAIRFRTVELSAMGAMVSNAFDPDRLRVENRRGAVTVAGSHRLPLGRWLNVTVVTRGGGTGFPPANVTVGSIRFPQWASRWLFELGRQAALLRGAALPPLDRFVRRVTIRPDAVSALVTLPAGSGMVSQLSSEAARASPQQVRDAYCRLAKLQSAEPSDDFAVHVRRAFATGGAGATPGRNLATIVALAMVLVDPQVGDLVDLPPAATDRCRIAPVDALLHARADLPKHWALSAALAATTGTQFSQAMGEWKELADSISRQSEFAIGDPSGFSFLDLAADRSGFLAGGGAVASASATRVATALAKAEQEDLLPQALMRLPDGMPNAVFVRRYGDTKDPRFLAAMAQIDAALRRSAERRAGPLAGLPTQ